MKKTIRSSRERINEGARLKMVVQAPTFLTPMLCGVIFVAGSLQNNVAEAESIQLQEILVEGKMIDGRPLYDTSAGPVDGYRAITGISATKTNTPVRETPQAINIIPRSVINDQKANTVDEVLQNVPGVVTVSSAVTPAADSTLIRGFFGDTWIDGLTSAFNLGDRQGLINVERVEVLKGPTGMLYGGSGTGTPIGGAINLVSKLPEKDAYGEVGFTFGSHNSVHSFVDINQPLSENVLFRFTGEYTDEESQIDVLERQRYNLNPTLTFTNNSTTSLTLQGKYTNWQGQDYQGLPATGTIIGNKLKEDLFLGPDDIPDSESEYKGLTVSLDHAFNSVWSTNIKTRFSKGKYDEKNQLVSDLFFGGANPIDPAVAALFGLAIPPNQWQLTDIHVFQEQEEKTITGHVLAEFDVGTTKNKFLLGADYSQLDTESFFDLATIPDPILGAFGVPLLIDLNDPNFVFPSYTNPGEGAKNISLELVTKGLTAQLQTTINDKIHLVAGVRRANIKIDYLSTNPLFAGDNTTDESKWLPRVGALVDITSQFSVFASYSEGMRGTAFSSVVGELKPEFSDQVEAGVKFNLDDRLSGTLAVYRINRENTLVRVPGTLGSAAEGKQKSEGFEADILYQMGASWQLLANYSYVDAEFVDNGLLSGIKVGNKLAGVPKQSGRVWVNYSVIGGQLKGLSLGSGVYMQDDIYLDANNLYEADGFFTVDAKVAYEKGDFGASLAVKNLTGEDYYIRSPFHVDGRVEPSDGATLYGTVSWKY